MLIKCGCEVWDLGVKVGVSVGVEMGVGVVCEVRFGLVWL